MKVRPAIQPGRMVLRRQPDGSFKQDYIYMALVVKYASAAGPYYEVQREDGVLRWGSTHLRVKPEDYWVNYVRD